MKKLFIFLTAIAMLGLVSCESDKQDISRETAVSEPVEEIPTEPVFMEYDQSDFAQINVAINKQNDEPIIPVNTYDLRKLADIKELSPCKLPENRDKIPEKYKPSAFIDWPTGEFDEEGFNNFCDNPSEAFFRSVAVCGDKAAVYADYDEICYFNHCYKIFEYDLKTGDISELYSYSSADSGENICEMNYIDGELYVITEKGKNSEYDITESEMYMCRVSDGRLETLFTAADIPSSTSYLHFSHTETGRFILLSWENYFNSDDEEISAYILTEYDTETGGFSEIFRKEDNLDSKLWKNFKVFLNGDDIITTGKDDDKCIYIEGGNFRINTGIKGMEVQAVRGNRVIALVDDTVQKTLYTYDLDKMECYISNVNGVDNTYLVGGNVLLSYGTANTLLIPELGASFSLSGNTNIMSSNSSQSFNGYDGEKMWFASASSTWLSGPDGYFVKTDDAIGDLVIIGG